VTPCAAPLARISATPARSRSEVLAAGVSAEELDFFERIGIIRPQKTERETVYPGDDVALLRTLANARRAGLTPEMLPHTILGPYVTALRELVRVELSLFREGVLPHAGAHLKELVEASAELSEHLVVLLRRRMLLPTLEELVREDAASRSKAPVEGTKHTKSKDTVRRARTRRTS
jgi:DNA-binding transcriptional MerR regulator